MTHTDKPITLADIAESERICGAMTSGPWRVCPDEKEEHGPLVCHDGDEHCGLCASGEAGYWAMTYDDAEGIAHARTRLPKMNALARELYDEIVMLAAEPCVRCPVPGEGNCGPCRAARLVERMESE
ncbi:hypothetical protein LCGC14_0516900 [marine sediment metagenome]|uniref:Uncharacterized protein n=1 Tax=marine sediment metagenome TaxID=412755 RepID=A0A0F9UL50_9ZZZZ